MSLIPRRGKQRTPRAPILHRWPADSTGPVENRVFDASFQLAEAASDLKELAGMRGSCATIPAVLGSATYALRSQSLAINRIRSLLRREAVVVPSGAKGASQLEELTAVLKEVERRLRHSAEGVDRARQLAAGMIEQSAARPSRNTWPR